MNWELDWPVGRAGVAVVSPSGTETAFLGGVTGGDEFEVASVTKLTTSLAALAAVSSGRLGLDQPVAGATRAGAAEVTVRHLLAHAGGFPFEPPGRPRPPGQRRIYSNVGFRLLADAVADARPPAAADELRARQSELVTAASELEAREAELEACGRLFAPSVQPNRGCADAAALLATDDADAIRRLKEAGYR